MTTNRREDRDKGRMEGRGRRRRGDEIYLSRTIQSRAARLARNLAWRGAAPVFPYSIGLILESGRSAFGRGDCFRPGWNCYRYTIYEERERFEKGEIRAFRDFKSRTPSRKIRGSVILEKINIRGERDKIGEDRNCLLYIIVPIKFESSKLRVALKPAC